MFRIDPRNIKVLGGYLVIIALMIMIGAIAVTQTVSLGRLVDYLTGPVSREVELADQIKSEVLYTRTAVEKFVYLLKDADKAEADRHIAKLYKLLERADREIRSPERTQILEGIRAVADRYVSEYEKMVIRLRAKEDNRNDLLADAREVEEMIYGIMEANKENSDLYRLAQGVLKRFNFAMTHIHKFLMSGAPEGSATALGVLNETLGTLEERGADNLVELMYAVEDFRDAFEGLAAVTHKMNEDIAKRFFPIIPEVIRLSEGISDSGWREMDRTGEEVADRVDFTRRVVTSIALFTAILGIFIGLFSANIIIRPISRVISGLSGSAQGLFLFSNRLLSSSHSLNDSSVAQAASLEETSAFLEEMASMTRQNADNARRANMMMKEAGEVVERSNRAMEELTRSMGEISQANQETTKIIRTIDGIAFQTKILSLNAAVEAARAGESGAGFMVVADEIGKLALRSAEAAKTTTEILEKTQKRVQGGESLVTETSRAFTDMAASTEKVGILVAEIDCASEEQALGIEQINKAVANIDEKTQQNTADAEEAASTSQAMNEEAGRMKGYVETLAGLVGEKIGPDGKGGKADAKGSGRAAEAGRRSRSGKLPSKRPRRRLLS